MLRHGMWRHGSGGSAGVAASGKGAARGATLAVLVFAVLGLAAPSAQAAFPGQNGLIAFSRAVPNGVTGPTTNPQPAFQYDIFTMTGEGALQLNQSNNPFDDLVPAFSPDGSKIAFQSNRNGSTFEVYTMNPDGSGVTRLTTGGGSVPSFSRSGRRIAFVSRRDGRSTRWTPPTPTATVRATTSSA